MTDLFTEEDVVATVTRLTRTQLYQFVDSDLVRPQRDAGRYVFRHVDIARLELLCDLSQDLDLDETALGVVISLIDQLHAARQELAAVAQAIDALPTDLQARLRAEPRRE
ncbi:chaperone modulator CbpM [Roseibacterium sp. SDUM158016]|uniref:chaperone modulator CbpM n=1 Tax=Roseicyclus sediminis TaxID=2980997 RepID=UPI0021D17087|nr:chaperone modulator CbpM [Roseibacterium sp. SDUM158016]MCU4652677.1 chaperone modulator CbpM [Roseibacterium sp. SDUM158016]